MFWLSRPPYVRWALAATVVIVGLVIEFRPTATVRHPFAVELIEVGSTVDESMVVWRDTPTGLFPPIELPTVADRRIQAGEPLLSTVASAANGAVPPGWWAMELDLPGAARTGMRVRVVTASGSTEGVVVDARDGDFGARSGLVAVPAEGAETLALAILDGGVAILLGG